MDRRALFLSLAAVACFPAWAGDAGFASRAADLLDRPAASARPISRVAKQQPLEILGRNGNWMQVRAGSATGWVRLLDVRFNVPPKAAPADKPRPPTDTGIRGFSEEDLIAGAPGRGQLDKLARYGVPAKDAAGFARAAGLKARQLDYIEAGDYLSMDELPDDFFDE